MRVMRMIKRLIISKRKFICLTFILCIIIFLAGCGQEDTAMNHSNISNPNSSTHSGENIHEPLAPEKEVSDDKSSLVEEAPTPQESEPSAEEPQEPSPPVQEPASTEEDSASESPTEPVESVQPVQPAEPAEPSVEESNKEYVINIVEFAFTPNQLEIKLGDSVTFINKDSVKHSATADDKSFDTGLLGLDEKGKVTFMKVGEFSYYCLPHPSMKATIIVKQ